jgi:hypothetical protein
MKRHILMTFCGAALLSWCGTANAQAPVAGQPYQVPAEYASFAAGSAINYGGYSYVIQANGTMLLSNPAADPPADDDSAPDGDGQGVQVPDAYAGSAVGSVISYNGSNYLIQNNGTMVGCGGAYQIPVGYSNSAVGSVILYGGQRYAIGVNKTMVLVSTTNTTIYKGGGSKGLQTTSGLSTGPHPGQPQHNVVYGPHPGQPQHNVVYGPHPGQPQYGPHPGQPQHNVVYGPHPGTGGGYRTPTQRMPAANVYHQPAATTQNRSPVVGRQPIARRGR